MFIVIKLEKTHSKESATREGLMSRFCSDWKKIRKTDEIIVVQVQLTSTTRRLCWNKKSLSLRVSRNVQYYWNQSLTPHSKLQLFMILCRSKKHVNNSGRTKVPLEKRWFKSGTDCFMSAFVSFGLSRIFSSENVFVVFKSTL